MCGNFGVRPDDLWGMRCDQCREQVSARLDGEDEPDPAVDRHLAGCSACRAFADRAAVVTRLARTGPAGTGPDLVDAVLAAAPGVPAVARRRRTGIAVRVGLAVVGVGQLALAVAGVTGAAITDHGGMEMAGASAAHFAHETSAWNLALGVGFLAVAARGGRLVAGLVPVLGAFVLVLAGLSVVDLTAARVDPGRLASHALVVVGLVLLLVHRRVLGDGGGHAVLGRWRRRDRPDPVEIAPPRPAEEPGAVARDRRAAA